MNGSRVAETGILLVLRAAVFISCRKYLLRSLYPDLQDLSGVDTSSKVSRDPLPSPITAREFSRKQQHGKGETLYSTLASDMFAGCFSESCMLFILLMFQGMSIFSSSTRLLNWQLSLFILLTCILVLIPFLGTLLLTAPGAQTRPTVPRMVLSTISVLLFVFALSCIPLPDAFTPVDRLTATLSRLVVVGTLILGLLAGFGAASSCWAHLPSKHPLTTPTEQDIVAAEYSLSSIRDDLERRRGEAERRAAAQQTDGTWMSRVMPSFRGDELLQEVKGLEALEYQMARNVDDLRQRRATSKFSSTFHGRLINVGGRLFATYCALRFVSCFVNIFLPAFTSLPAPSPDAPPSASTSYPDVVTEALAEVLGRLSPRVQFADVARATRHVSLVLVGAIILSSIRLVLRGVTRALRVTSRTLGASLMLLFLAQLMAIYLLSTLVQLRASFPPPPPAPFSPSSYSSSTGEPTPVNLFATIPEFQVFGAVFDACFLLSASASFAVRWAAHRINGPKE